MCALAPIGMLLAAAPTAYADQGTATYQCQVPVAGATTAPVAITLTASPADPKAGQEVTFTWKSEPVAQLAGPAPYDENSMQTTGTLVLSGARSGTVTMTGARQNPAVPPGSPLPIGEMTGKATIGDTGETAVTPGRFVVDVAYRGRAIQVPCEPQNATALLTLGGKASTDSDSDSDDDNTLVIALGVGGGVLLIAAATTLVLRRRRHATV